MYFRKLLLALLILTGSMEYVSAQNGGTAPLAKGGNQLNFGLGFSDNGLPVYLSFDFAVHKDVTLTPEVHVRFVDSDNNNNGNGENDNENNVRAGTLFKADYHWNYLIGIPSNWDFYAGLRSGFEFDDDVDFDMGAQVGGRWYFTDQWGLNLELAGGTGFDAIFGMSMKF